MAKTPRPFKKDEHLSSGHLESLRDWLAENVAPDMLLAGQYQVTDLVEDLNTILTGMWSDGIDAMGEDA